MSRLPDLKCLMLTSFTAKLGLERRTQAAVLASQLRKPTHDNETGQSSASRFRATDVSSAPSHGSSLSRRCRDTWRSRPGRDLRRWDHPMIAHTVKRQHAYQATR
jgi:hypothetical protein